MSQLIKPPLEVNEVLAIIQSESTGNPDAVNPPENPKDFGLMQVEIPTACTYGAAAGVDLLDPEVNLLFGMRALAHCKSLFYAEHGNAYVAAYNEGIGNFAKGIPDPDYVAAFEAHLAELNALSNPGS